jgi:hypothetical protein
MINLVAYGRKDIRYKYIGLIVLSHETGPSVLFNIRNIAKIKENSQGKRVGFYLLCPAQN